MSGQPMNTLAQNTEINGNLVPAAAMQSVLATMNAFNIASDSTNFATSAGATITVTALQNAVQRLTNGGAVTVTIDSAYNIVNTIPGAFAGQKFPFTIVTNAGTTVATPTLSDTAVTLSGTTTCTAAGLRVIQGTVTQLTTTTGIPVTAGTTFTSLTQVGSTNNYTVALGTNALVPVVGQAIYLNVTAGTLPSGWYPINLVTSAVSFVIAAPNSNAAWTATAGTVPGTTTVPSSAYTIGMPGLYSPLVTLTGMYGTVLNIMVV